MDERLLGHARQAAAERKCGVPLVEQRASSALRVAGRRYVMSAGPIALAGTTKDPLSRRDEIKQLYMADCEDGRAP